MNEALSIDLRVMTYAAVYIEYVDSWCFLPSVTGTWKSLFYKPNQVLFFICKNLIEKTAEDEYMFMLYMKT